MMEQAVPLTSILTGNTRKRKYEEVVGDGKPSIFKGHVVAPPLQTDGVTRNAACLRGRIIVKGKVEEEEQQQQYEDIDDDGDDISVQDPISDDVIDPELMKESSSQPLSISKKAAVELHSSRLSPIGNNVKVRSIKSILMQRKPAKDDKIVIDLDDETGDNCSPSGTGQTLEDSTTPRLQPKTVGHPINAKPTKLKDIFSNFSKPTTVDTEIIPENINEGPIIRYHNVSSLSSLEAPFPKIQLTEPDDTITVSSDITLPLKRRTHRRNPTSVFNFSADEYSNLNCHCVKTDLDSKGKEICYSINKDLTKTTSMWPELFSPRKVSEVILEKSLKNDVQNWIMSALKKLRKPTTRNKLLKSYKQQFGEFDDFIVADNAIVDNTLEENDLPEEFVPLMVLYGEGIGKNTLISTIVNNLNGQVYEINASQNRAKRDILDVLSEYCTSYYVKDKAVSGVVLISDADVVFREHDKFFWLSIEKLLLTSRKPIIITARDVNFIPTNLQEICRVEGSLFQARRVTSRTVAAFLKKYCERLQLTLEESVLQLLAERNNSNIRKCLLDLQFWFSSGNKLLMQGGDNNNNSGLPYTCGSLNEAADLVDLMSYCAVLGTKTAYKSSLREPLDHTLKSSAILAKFNSPDADDRFKWTNDYMLDYRLHLNNELQSRLFPFELDIAKDLENILATNYSPICSRKYAISTLRYHRTINTLEHYLSTRVKTQPFAHTSIADVYNLSNTLLRRSTRGSSEDILSLFKDFNGYNRNDGSDTTYNAIIEDIIFDFACAGKRTVLAEYFPYVLEVARNEEEAKAYNRRLFAERSKGVPETRLNYAKILRELGEGGQFRSVWFKSSPGKLISCWKLKGSTKFCTD